MEFNPWHSVSVGDDAPNVVNGIIEISRGSRAKYELDKETGLLKLDRVIRSAVYYPTNYGFIPRTYGEDGDPLDILVLSQVDILPLTLVEAKIVGVMNMIDGGEGDDKIIAVPVGDNSVAQYNDIEDLPESLKAEIVEFFVTYKNLEKKTVEVTGFKNAAIAKEILEKAIISYNEKFAK